MEDATNELINSFSGWSISNIPNFGLRLVGAILLLLIGRWLAKWIVRWADRFFKRTELDETLTTFFDKLIYFSLLAIFVIAALNLLGFETSSIVAILAASTLAIGLALQDSLSNLASGILIIILRPYRVKNLVDISGEIGYVEEIRFFHTVLRTPDNKILFIPNSDVMDNNIINYSEMDWIRLDLTFGIGYDDNLLQAKQILEGIIADDKRIAVDPAPVVAVRELGDSSVNFAVRPYVKEQDMIQVAFDLTEQVKLQFDANGISIPFPQRDVHLIQAV